MLIEAVDGYFLLDMLLKGAVLLGAAYAAAYAMKSSSAAVRHAMWALTFSGLLLLPAASALLPQWNLPLFTDPVLTVERTTFPSGRATSIPPTSQIPRPRHQDGERLTWTHSGDSGLSHELGGGDMPLSSWLVLLWAAGALFLLGRLAAGMASLGRVIRDAEPARGWEDVLAQSKRKLGLRRQVRLRVHPRIQMPRTMGAVRPVILLPEEANKWPEKKKRIILLHELTHVKRWDYPTHMVALMARALHWPNPLTWMAARRLLTRREEACDNEVVARGGVKPSEYAHSLLEFAEGMLQRDRPGAGVVAMAHRKSELKSRIEAVLDPGKSRSSLSIKEGLAMTATLMLCLSLLAAAHPVSSAPAAEVPPIASLQSNEGAPDYERTTRADTAGSHADSLRQVEQEGAASARAEEKKQDQKQETAGGKLKRASGRTAEADTSGKEQIQIQAVRALSELPDEEAIPRLIQVARAHPNEKIRLYAVTALGEKEGEAVTTFFKSFVRNEASEVLVERAVRALGNQSAGVAVPLLLDVARDHPSLKVREAAVFELARSQDERALSLLMDIARTGESRQLRMNAIRGLAQMDSPQAVETLAELAKSGESTEVSIWAIQGLDQANSEAALEMLIDVAKSPGSAEVRQHAIRVLSKHDSSAVLNALITIAETAENPDVKMAAVQAVGRRGDGRTADVLMDILQQ